MPIRKLGLAAALVLAGLATWWLYSRGSLPADTEVLAAQSGQSAWYRGNLHTHSLWSDGDDYPEMVADTYRREGYHFLALTEHNTLQDGERWIDATGNIGGAVALAKLEARFPSDWVQRREVDGRTQVRLKRFDEVAAELAESGRFLLLQGEEISDSAASASLHLNAINLAEYLPPTGGSSVENVLQRNVDALAEQSARLGQPMLIHINHPNFLDALTAEDLMRIRGTGLFEVYNGHPLSLNEGRGDRASTERIWDIVLTWRIAALGLPLMYGVANDDSHQYHGIPSGRAEPGRGWIMVLADDLSAASLIPALQQGHFYASTGVQLTRVAQSSLGLRVEVDQQSGVDYLIEFIGTRRGFDHASEPVVSRTGRQVYGTRRYSDEVGAILSSKKGASAEYRFDDDDLYVRARVTSTRRHPRPSQPQQFEQAWVQPVLGPAGRNIPQEELLTAPPAPPLQLHAGQLAPAFVPLSPRTAATLMASTTSDCSLDRLVDAAGAPATVWHRTGTALLGGWLADRKQPQIPQALSVVLRGSEDLAIEAGGGGSRPDVAAALGSPALEGAGFNLTLSLTSVPVGDYAIVLVAHYLELDLACDTGKRLVVQ